MTASFRNAYFLRFSVMLLMIFQKHIFLTRAHKVPGTKPNVKLLLLHVIIIIIIIIIIIFMVALYFTVCVLICSYSLPT